MRKLLLAVLSLAFAASPSKAAGITFAELNALYGDITADNAQIASSGAALLKYCRDEATKVKSFNTENKGYLMTTHADLLAAEQALTQIQARIQRVKEALGTDQRAQSKAQGEINALNVLLSRDLSKEKAALSDVRTQLKTSETELATLIQTSCSGTDGVGFVVCLIALSETSEFQTLAGAMATDGATITRLEIELNDPASLPGVAQIQTEIDDLNSEIHRLNTAITRYLPLLTSLKKDEAQDEKVVTDYLAEYSLDTLSAAKRSPVCGKLGL